MKKIVILFSFFLTSKSFSQVKKAFADTISSQKFYALKTILKKYSSVDIQDTVIIKYDFNNETCWDMLDGNSKDYINTVKANMQALIKKQKNERPGVSIFRFRQKGKNINKLIKWDSTIFVDSSGQIFNLIFKNKNQCGNSAIILPDRNVIIIQTDPHFEAMFYTRERILKVFSGK